MCLILFALDAHAGYPLVLAANRDEFYGRPTQPAHWWPDAPGVLAGRDEDHGGTWLGVTPGGRVAAVTNYRAPPAARRAGAPSRGWLVRDFLLSGATPADYLAQLEEDAGEYEGFNLLVGEIAPVPTLHYYSNRSGAPPVRLGAGVYGLSNALLDTPWPKVRDGKAALAAALDRAAEPNVGELFALLAHAEPAPDAELPDTGVEGALERALSSRFIATPEYGTRSSTVLLGDSAGGVTFVERTYRGGPGEWSEVEERFRITE